MSRYLGMVFDRANNDNLAVLQAYDKKVGNPDIYWLPAEERQRWVARGCTPTGDEWVTEHGQQRATGESCPG